MLKAIVEDEQIAKTFGFGTASGAVPVATDDNRDTGEADCHELGFIARLFLVHFRSVSAAHDHDPATAAPVPPRQDHRAISQVPELSREFDHQWGLAGSARGQITHADDRMLEAVNGKNAFVVKSGTGRHELSEDPAHSAASRVAGLWFIWFIAEPIAASTRAVAPEFCSATLRALIPRSVATS